MARRGAIVACTAIAGAAGAIVGARHHDVIDFWLSRLPGGLSKGAQATVPWREADGAAGLLRSAVGSVRAGGEYAVLCTLALPDSGIKEEGGNELALRGPGVSARLVQPWAIEAHAGRTGSATEPMASGEVLDAALAQRGARVRPRVFFNTSAHSRKAAELARDGRATLSYVNADALSCVTLRGRVEQMPAPLHARHWKGESIRCQLSPVNETADDVCADWLRVFYPEGPHGGRFITFRMDPTDIEVVAVSSGIYSHRQDNRGPALRWVPSERRKDDPDDEGGEWVVACTGKEDSVEQAA